MGFQYANHNTWVKKAIGGFVLAIFGLGLIIFQSFYITDQILLLLGFIPVIVAALQGVHYMKRADMDYVYLEEDRMLIYRGPILPREKVDYRYIEYCIEVYDYDRKYMTIKLRDTDTTIEVDWLSTEDQEELKKQLEKRTNIENLFRSRTV